MGSNQHTLQHLMRHAFHKGTIHESSGIALVGITDKDLFVSLFRGEETPFRSRGEAAASAPAETGNLDSGNSLFGSHGKSFFQPFITAVCHIVVKIGGVDASGKSQHLDQFFFLAERRNFKAFFCIQSQDLLHIILFHIAVKNRRSVFEDGFDNRFGITVSETASRKNGQLRFFFQSFKNFICSGGDTATCHTDTEKFYFITHFSRYSLRILLIVLRSSFPKTLPLILITGARLQQPRQATVSREKRPSLSVSPSRMPSSCWIHVPT